MKTALIPVDPLDDLAALQDKIAWAKAPRALLLWPQHGCAVQRTVDFVHLRRAADALGTQIALLTREQRVRREATAAGIPVFPDRKKALQKAWRWRRVKVPRRRRHPDLYTLQTWAHRPPPWSRLSPWQRWGAFVAGLLAVLLLAAFTLPGARLTLTPTHTTRTVAFTATVSAAYATVNAAGQLPARWETVTAGDSGTLPVSGLAPLPLTPAHATIALTNLTTQAINVPQGTRIHSRGTPMVFVTTETVELPPGPGTKAEVEAVSLTRGREANRPAHDLGFLEGPLAFQVVADNPLPAHGGRDTRVAAPTTDDYQRLESTLRGRLAAQALAMLEERFPDAWVMLPSLQPEADLERTFDPARRAPANTLHLTLRARFRALLVSRADVHWLAQQALAAEAPDGMHLVPESIHLTPGEVKRVSAGRYTWHLQATGTYVAPIDPASARRVAAGHTPRAAAARLQQAFPLAAPPDIHRWPAWWPWVPWLSLRLSVTVRVP